MNLTWSTRSTQRCTIGPKCGIFSLNSEPQGDTRVISLEEVGEKDIKNFVKYSAAVAGSHTHRKIHTVFLKAEDVHCTKIDLCAFFAWCKCSAVIESPEIRVCEELEALPESMSLMYIKTPFVRALLTVQLMCSVDKCEVNILNGNKTVQIQIKRKEGFNGTIITGIGLHTPNVCTLCKTPNSDTVKLRVCSRCFTFDKIKLYYCSQKCQRLDFQRHCHVCTYDWFADDWREEAPRPVKSLK